jgi:transketolase
MLKEFLDPDMFGNSVEMKAIRSGYGEGVIEAGRADKNVVVISADLSESTRVEDFSKEFPERFFQVGVAEQNMASIAAGLGISGKTPFISSYAVFSPGRNWEQIRTTIAYNDSNVKIAGHHAGVSTGPDGATHQAIEDIATMRAMPNMKVIVPCDAEEARKATVAAAKIWGPVYLRMAREKTPIMTGKKTPFVPGKAEVFWDSSDGNSRKTKKPQVAIIACGPLVHEALTAAKMLEKEGIGSVVVNCHTIKPLDGKTIVALAKKCGAVVTVEEHNIIGGLGGAVAELLAKEHPTCMEFIGMKDGFGESGKPRELIEKYGMSDKDIIGAAKRAIKRK